MAEAVYFVVERHPSTAKEVPALYHEHLPPRFSGKNASRDGLVYPVRVDTLPNARIWLRMSLTDLYEAYCKARDGNQLPPVYREPALSASEPAKAKLGHREGQVARPWKDLPAEPWPTVEDLDRRAARRERADG